MLQIRGVTKSYGGQDVLQDVSLEFRDAEIVCLLGPSGCGKTTLLRIIAGLDSADRGELLFQGRDLARVPVHERNFGLMFQGYALFPHMSVEQNVAFGLRMRGSDDVISRTREILTLVGLAGMGARDVSSLSGGEQQRVALARSLAPRPALLMLDEPLASLDAGLRERLMPELRRIFRELKQTVITVTHDQHEANAIADRIAVMNAGRIEQIDSPPGALQPAAHCIRRRFPGAWQSCQRRLAVAANRPCRSQENRYCCTRPVLVWSARKLEGVTPCLANSCNGSTKGSAGDFPRRWLVKPCAFGMKWAGSPSPSQVQRCAWSSNRTGLCPCPDQNTLLWLTLRRAGVMLAVPRRDKW